MFDAESNQIRRHSQEITEHKETTDKSSVTESCLSSYLSQDIYCGGYSGEDPPLPIPNREVKLTIADGTAPPGGRVGSCHFFLILDIIRYRGFFLRGKERSTPSRLRRQPLGAFRPYPGRSLRDLLISRYSIYQLSRPFSSGSRMVSKRSSGPLQ